jgi:hypothetical protein
MSAARPSTSVQVRESFAGKGILPPRTSTCVMPEPYAERSKQVGFCAPRRTTHPARPNRPIQTPETTAGSRLRGGRAAFPCRGNDSDCSTRHRPHRYGTGKSGGRRTAAPRPQGQRKTCTTATTPRLFLGRSACPDINRLQDKTSPIMQCGSGCPSSPVKVQHPAPPLSAPLGEALSLTAHTSICAPPHPPRRGALLLAT